MERDLMTNTLLNFNNNWKIYFERERDYLIAALGSIKYENIEHIGATSVVLCKTAGTIDLLLSIKNKIDFITVKNVIIRKGYQVIENLSNYDKEVFFVRRNKYGKIVATIRLVEYCSDEYNRIVSFKYYLRQSEQHVKRYNDFRETLIKKCGRNYKKYQSVKADFIESVLNEFCVIKQ